MARTNEPRDEETFERMTPAVSRLTARRWRLAAVVAALVLLGLMALFDTYPPNRPVEYEDELDHFYYGSIGSDISGGLPLKMIQVLPEMFPEYLPEGAEARDYTAFGFIQEPGEEMPIGFSIRRRFIDFTALNCASCHTGSVRGDPDAEPAIIPTMPANTVDLLAFFRFLFETANDPRFTGERILAAMEEEGIAEPVDRLLYPLLVPRVKEALQTRRRKLQFMLEPDYTPFGPGRVNTFDTFKFDQFAYYYEEHEAEVEEIYGIVDFTSIWNQGARDGLWLHWDGNNNSVRERNFSAAIGAGAHPPDMEIASLFRLEDWLDDLPPPEYPFPLDGRRAQEGAEIYRQYCYECHDFEGARVGTVVPLEEIGTDRHRLDSYTQTLLEAQKDYTAGYFWSFTHFRTTNGYANHPLDGLWARAPYLHNGSVPNLWQLLKPEEERPEVFTIGGDVYDPENLGFEHQVLVGSRADGYFHPDGRPYTGTAFVLDTKLLGNGNQGHSGPRYGTELSDQEKRALIEYFKWQDRPRARR